MTSPSTACRSLLPRSMPSIGRLLAPPRRRSEHAAECGRRLIEAKALLPHGEWLPWLEANTEVIPRQSQKYMRLADNWEEIKSEPAGRIWVSTAPWN